MRKYKATIYIALSIIISLLTIQIVFADVLGINIINMLKSKVFSMSDAKTLSISEELSNAKQETINETTAYLNNYLSSIDKELDSYYLQEKEIAKQKLKSKTAEIENILDPERSAIIAEAKIRIKLKIDSELAKQSDELDNELNMRISENLK